MPEQEVKDLLGAYTTKSIREIVKTNNIPMRRARDMGMGPLGQWVWDPDKIMGTYPSDTPESRAYWVRAFIDHIVGRSKYCIAHMSEDTAMGILGIWKVKGIREIVKANNIPIRRVMGDWGPRWTWDTDIIMTTYTRPKAQG